MASRGVLSRLEEDNVGGRSAEKTSALWECQLTSMTFEASLVIHFWMPRLHMHHTQDAHLLHH